MMAPSRPYQVADGSEKAQPGRQCQQWLVHREQPHLKLGYLLFLPAAYEEAERSWPLMLFLHGAGERGRDLQRVKKHGPPKVVEQRADFPFIVVSPQCPAQTWWVEPSQQMLLEALLDSTTDHYRIDRQRVYLTGISMGGFGSWHLAARQPERFAALVPICGGGDPDYAERLKDLPIWVFHGARDDIVPAQYSDEMVEALKRVGGNVRYTRYPHAMHDSWTETYNNPELYQWLLQHSTSAKA